MPSFYLIIHILFNTFEIINVTIFDIDIHLPKVPNPPKAGAVVLVVVCAPNKPKPPNGVPPVPVPVIVFPVDGPTKLLKFVLVGFVFPKRFRAPEVFVAAVFVLVPKPLKPPSDVAVVPSVGADIPVLVEPNPPNVLPLPKVGTVPVVPVDGLPNAEISRSHYYSEYFENDFNW